MKNSIGKIIAVVFIIIIGFAGAGFITLRIFFPPEKIKSMITAKVEEALGREVAVGKAGVTVFPVIGFTLADVDVANTRRPGYSQESFLHFDRLRIEVSLGSLLKKQPEIKKIILIKPKILVEVDTAGEFNFSDLAVFPSDTQKVEKEKKDGGLPVLPVPISLSLFRIEDGRIEYHDARSGQDFVIGDLDDRIELAIDKELKNITTQGELSCTDVSLKTKDISRPLSDLSITFNHDIKANLVDGVAEVKLLRLSFQKVAISMAGDIQGLNQTPVFNLALNSDDILLQDILREVPVELAPVVAKMQASGILNIGLTINGALEEGKPLPVRGTLAISEGMFKHTELPKAIQQIALNCSFTDNSLDVKSLKMRLGDNPVALKAKVDNFKKPVVDCKVLAKINLSEVKEFAELPPGFAFGGKMELDAAAQGVVEPSDPTKIAVRGNLKLQDASFLTPPLTKPAVVNGTFFLSSQAIAQKLSVVIGASSMKMDARIKNYLSFIFPDSTRKLPRPSLTFNVTSPRMNADEFLPPPEKTVEKEQTEEKSGAGMIAPLPGVDVQGSVKARTFVFKKIPMSNVTIKISAVNDIVNVGFSTGFAKGTISEKLYADMRNVSDVKISNSLSVNNVEVSDMLSHFGGFLSTESALNREINNLPNSLFGKVSLSSAVKSNGGNPDALVESLTGDLAVAMADGIIKNSLIVDRLSGVLKKFVTIGDITFSDLKGKLKIANKNVLVEELKFGSAAGDWNADGKVGFDASLDLMLKNRLSRSHSGKLLQIQGKGKDLLKGLAGNSKFSQAAGSLIDNSGIPADKNGRVTVLMALGGTASDPKASFAGFGKGTTGGSDKQAASPKKQVVKAVKAKINTAKIEAQKKLAEERKRAEAAARQKADAQRKIAEKKKQELLQKKKKAAKTLKKDAANKLKKLF